MTVSAGAAWELDTSMGQCGVYIVQVPGQTGAHVLRGLMQVGRIMASPADILNTLKYFASTMGPYNV